MANELRRVNTWLFRDDRIGQCGWRLGKAVGIKRQPPATDGQEGRCHFTGRTSCGSAWACLSCAGKVRAARGAQIDHVVKAHLADGGHATMLSFTLPHTPADQLDQLYQAIVDAWARMTSGSAWKAFTEIIGLKGWCRAAEVTLTDRNGWHPHLHVLILHDTHLDPEEGEVEEFRWWFGQRWARFIGRQLGREVHELYGVDATPIKDQAGIGAYVSKIHYELTRSDLKTGGREGANRSRTPWQVGLDGANSGDAQDLARWREFVTTTKGRKVITASNGFWNLYSPPPETVDMSDEEIASQETDGTVEAYLDDETYDALWWSRRALLAAALTAYERTGLTGLLGVIADTGLHAVVVDGPDGKPLIRTTRPRDRLHHPTPPPTGGPT
jgi:hypothetical protein